MKRQYFPLIDLLRGFAAISVVVYHVINHLNWISFPTSGPLCWFRVGWMGVDLFFVISGFVIALTTIRTYQTCDNYLQFCKKFLTHRLARIVPLYYLTCFTFIIFINPEIMFANNFFHNIFTHMFFIHNWFIADQGSINGVNWSLGAEVQFYLLMMVAAPWIVKAPVWVIMSIAIIISWCWRGIVFHFLTAHGSADVYHEFVYTTQMPAMLDEFGFGIIAARIITSDKGKSIMENNIFSYVFLPFSTLSVIFITNKIFWNEADYWQSAPMVVCFRSLLALSCILLIILACSLGKNETLLKILRPLTYLGTISYGIYLWHLSVILPLKNISWMTGPRCISIVICASIILATLSWNFFEQPIYQKFTRKKAPDTAS